MVAAGFDEGLLGLVISVSLFPFVSTHIDRQIWEVLTVSIVFCKFSVI